MSRFRRRPWGWWAVLLDRKHFKVKVFRVSGGCALSRQFHLYRRELWCVLKGYGQLTGDVYPSCIKAGDFVSIGLRSWHKFMAVRPTWVLEIQYGEKCQEEDIVRAELY